MARQKKEAEFIEFNVEGKEFKYSGRLYPQSKKDTAKCTITPMTLCLNGLITIKGCKLFQTDKSAWVQFPQYSYGEKNEWKDYVFVDKGLNKDMDALVYELEKLLEK